MELEVRVAGEREKTGAMVCVSKGEGINILDDVINDINIHKQKINLKYFGANAVGFLI